MPRKTMAVNELVTLAAVFHRFDGAGDHIGALTYLLAFFAGIASFLSPCVLPLVPGYVSMVTGLDLTTLEGGVSGNRRRIMLTTGMFVAGFAVVYVPFGMAAAVFGGFLHRHQHQFTRASGVLVLAFAVFLAGSVFLRAPWLYQEKRFHPQLGGLGRLAPFVLGAAFAFGWTPCSGPVLGSILTIAAQHGRAWTGGSLLLAYTLGLGLPFLAFGLALGSLSGLLRWIKPHLGLLVIVSSVVMAVFGVLLLTDQLATLNSHLSNFLDHIGLGWLGNWS